MEGTTSFKTLAGPSPETLFKEKKSKFYGYAFPIKTEDAVKPIIQGLQKEHPQANHFCFAWKLNPDGSAYRASDDGEPNNTAGMPIYGQLNSFGLTNVLLVVVRIFGGTKLGAGGLIQAYRAAAKITLEASNIKMEFVTDEIMITVPYGELQKVMRYIKQDRLKIVSQDMGLNCTLTVSVDRSDTEKIVSKFKGVRSAVIKVK